MPEKAESIHRPSVRLKLESQVAIAIAPARLTRNAVHVIPTWRMRASVLAFAIKPVAPRRRPATGAARASTRRVSSGTSSDSPVRTPSIVRLPHVVVARGTQVRADQSRSETAVSARPPSASRRPACVSRAIAADACSASTGRIRSTSRAGSKVATTAVRTASRTPRST